MMMQEKRPSTDEESNSTAQHAAPTGTAAGMMDGDDHKLEKPSQTHIETALGSESATFLASLTAAGAVVESIQSGPDGKPVFLIRSTANDPASPRSWTPLKRYGIVCLASFLNILVTLCVSGYS